MRPRPRRPPSGFSLAEVLVSLALLGLLLGGMAQVFRAGLGSWGRINRSLTARRGLRWALDRLGEDLRLAGHRFPPPEPDGRPEPGSAIRLLRERPIRTQDGGALAPRDGWEATADELSFTLDEPVPVRAVLARAVPGPEVRLRSGQGARILPGDRLVVEDDPVETARVAREAHLAPGAEARVPVDEGAGFRCPHAPGRRVQVVRPRQVVRYAVAGLRLDLGPPEPVPCLVRFTAPAPPGGGDPPWDGVAGPAVGPGGEVGGGGGAGQRVPGGGLPGRAVPDLGGDLRAGARGSLRRDSPRHALALVAASRNPEGP